jgi:hypothetical protein
VEWSIGDDTGVPDDGSCDTVEISESRHCERDSWRPTTHRREQSAARESTSDVSADRNGRRPAPVREESTNTPTRRVLSPESIESVDR